MSLGAWIALAVVLALQVAIHVRLAVVPARAAARFKNDADARARTEVDALQQAATIRVGQLVTELQRFHDYAAEDYRARVVATEQRARVAEARNADAAQVMTGLHAHAREAAVLVTDLRTLVSDLVDLVYAETERRSGAAPGNAEVAAPSAEVSDDGDQRKTTEMPRPPDSAEADDQGWDDPNEHTKVWPKQGTPAAVPGAPHEAHAMLPGPTPSTRAQRGPRPSATSAPRRPAERPEPRRAMPPRLRQARTTRPIAHRYSFLRRSPSPGVEDEADPSTRRCHRGARGAPARSRRAALSIPAVRRGEAVSSPELEAWAALRSAFAKLLRAQRTGRPLEEMALYMAELTTAHGLALAQAIHAAHLGPDPALFLETQRDRVSVGVLTAEEMVTAATNAGPLFEYAAVALRCTPAPHHVRVLFATEQAEVVQMPLTALLPSTEGGVS